MDLAKTTILNVVAVGSALLDTTLNWGKEARRISMIHVLSVYRACMEMKNFRLHPISIERVDEIFVLSVQVAAIMMVQLRQKI